MTPACVMVHSVMAAETSHEKAASVCAAHDGASPQAALTYAMTYGMVAAKACCGRADAGCAAHDGASN